MFVPAGAHRRPDRLIRSGCQACRRMPAIRPRWRQSCECSQRPPVAGLTALTRHVAHQPASTPRLGRRSRARGGAARTDPLSLWRAAKRNPGLRRSLYDQRQEAKRGEVGIGQCNRERSGTGQAPRAVGAAGGSGAALQQRPAYGSLPDCFTLSASGGILPPSHVSRANVVFGTIPSAPARSHFNRIRLRNLKLIRQRVKARKR